jgi:hypothetical protein
MVERLRVPDDFVHDLRCADGVSSRAGSAALEGACGGVAHMGHVIGTIQILGGLLVDGSVFRYLLCMTYFSVPAGGKAERRHDALCTSAIWECHKLRGARYKRVQACIRELSEARCLFKSPGLDIPDKHAKSLLLSDKAVRNNCF